MSFLWATILVNAVSPVNALVHSLLVGTSLGANAVSALNLYRPICQIEEALYFVLSLGAFLIYSKYLGERNKEMVHKTFATSFLGICFLIIIITLVFLLFSDPIFGFFCTDPAIMQHFRGYAIVNSIFVFALKVLALFFSSILSVEGKPKECIVANVIIISVNFIVSFVFVKLCHWGTESVAYAMCIAFFCSLLYQAKHILKDYKHLFSNLFSGFSLSALKNNALQAMPKVSAFSCIVIAITLINLFIQKECGKDGSFVWSIGNNILSITQNSIIAIGITCLTLCSFYKGQNDTKGLKYIVKRSNICAATVVAVVFGLLLVFPGVFARIFGANTAELIHYTKSSLRYCAMLFPGLLLIYYYSSIFQLKGNLALSTISLGFYPLVVLVSTLFAKYLPSPWLIFPISGVALIVLTLLSILLSKKSAPHKEALHSYDISIKAEKDSLKNSLTELSDNLKNLGLDHLLVFKINVCLEEIMLNIVENSGANMANHYFDIRISVLDKTVECSIKDDNKAFNPIHLPADKRGMGLQIIFGLCPNIGYKYMYGQNMSYLSWEKD